eukprot:scaffold140725_cov36-Tisochrysis_lutea.AAC.3
MAIGQESHVRWHATQRMLRQHGSRPNTCSADEERVRDGTSHEHGASLDKLKIHHGAPAPRKPVTTVTHSFSESGRSGSSSSSYMSRSSIGPSAAAPVALRMTRSSSAGANMRRPSSSRIWYGAHWLGGKLDCV